VYAPGTFELLSLPGTWYGAVEFQYPPHLRQGAYEEEGRCINTLKVPSTLQLLVPSIPENNLYCCNTIGTVAKQSVLLQKQATRQAETRQVKSPQQFQRRCFNNLLEAGECNVQT
jgi:hypothetical protein